MVTIQQAVKNAAAFSRSVLGEEAVQDLRLEEVESDEYNGRPVWFVTLSFRGWSQGLEALVRDRVYKRFIVDKESGEVLAMKIRELASA